MNVNIMSLLCSKCIHDMSVYYVQLLNVRNRLKQNVKNTSKLFHWGPKTEQKDL